MFDECNQCQKTYGRCRLGEYTCYQLDPGSGECCSDVQLTGGHVCEKCDDHLLFVCLLKEAFQELGCPVSKDGSIMIGVVLFKPNGKFYTKEYWRMPYGTLGGPLGPDGMTQS